MPWDSMYGDERIRPPPRHHKVKHPEAETANAGGVGRIIDLE